MATQSVEFSAASGQTVTARLFSAGSDTVVQTASAVAEATNRNGVYTATFTDAAAGVFDSGRASIQSGMGNTGDNDCRSVEVRKNTAGQVVAFQAVSTTDGSAVTTGTPTVYYTIDGGTQGTGAGTTTHEGNGCWSYAPAQAETNGNHVVFTFTLTGAVSQSVNVYPVAFNPTDAVRLGLTALPNAAAGAAGGLPTDSTGKTAFNDLSAAGVRAAVGMTSANLDAQLSDKTGYSLSSSGLNAVTAWAVALTGNLTGNVTGSVGSVTSPVTAGTVTDKTGYSLNTAGNTAVVDSLFARIPTKATQHTVERIFWNNDRTSIVDDGEVVANVANTAQSFETTLTGMADKYNDSLIQFTSGALEGESNSIASIDAGGVVTFHDAFTAVPSAADEFIVRPESNHSPEEIAAAVEALLSATTRSELASAPAANASLADKLTWLAQLARNKMQSTALQQTLYADDGTTVVATFAVSDDGTTATRGEAT